MSGQMSRTAASGRRAGVRALGAPIPIRDPVGGATGLSVHAPYARRL